MNTIDQKVSDFQILPLVEKKDIVLSTLEQLKNVNKNFAYIYDNIQELEWVDDVMDEIYDSFYKEVLELSEREQDEIIAMELSSFEKMKKKIEEIHQWEKKLQSTEDVEVLLRDI